MEPQIRQYSQTHKEESGTFHLVAYRVSSPALKIIAAPADRGWMDSTPGRFANRCLPLRIANQAGWVILNQDPIDVVWHGGQHPSSLEIHHVATPSDMPPISHFGSGILTWRLPYLFRTPPGYNLIVRGPTNWCKDGACGLDAVVETDWAVQTFTMNWKLTRPRLVVRFDQGEPICMICPQKRHEIELFEPETCEISTDPELEAQYRNWKGSRNEFNSGLKEAADSGVAISNDNGWQKHYFKGLAFDGTSFKEHQMKLQLRSFKGLDASI